MECVLPETDYHYNISVAELRKGGPTEDSHLTMSSSSSSSSFTYLSSSTSSSSTSSSSSTQVSSSSRTQTTSSNPTVASTTPPRVSDPHRSVLTFDGCWHQLTAIMNTLNSELTARDYEGFKFAAASTMVEQPNDVGHIHTVLKNHYKGRNYNKILKWETPTYLNWFDVLLKEDGILESIVRFRDNTVTGVHYSNDKRRLPHIRNMAYL